MLNENQIKTVISSGEISINYYFRKDGNKIIKDEKMFSTTDTKLLDSNRLKLTLGPVIKVLNNNVKKKNRFRNKKDCFDLSTNDNEYILGPGESICILTNEWISFDGKHAALIMPRVSLSEVGIILTPAYIDSYYYGILRLNIHNNSKYYYKLSTLDPIAQCFFFDFNNDTVNELRQKAFSSKSSFVGQNWDKILGSDADPFPIKKGTVPNSPIKNYFFSFFKLIFNAFNDNAVFTTMIALITGAILLYNTADNYIKQIDKINENFISNSTEIEIAPNDNYGETTVIIECRKDEVISVLCNNNNIDYYIASYGQNSVEIRFSYSLEQPSENMQRIDFNYTVVKRIE